MQETSVAILGMQYNPITFPSTHGNTERPTEKHTLGPINGWTNNCSSSDHETFMMHFFAII